MSDFSYPDEILEKLLFLDNDFQEISEFCAELSNLIKEPHKNFLLNPYPSALTQCILECFKIKRGFKSSTWYSKKAFDKVLIKEGAKPVKFSRLGALGEVLNYELFNEDDVIEKVSDNVEETKSLVKEEVEDEVKKAIVSLVLEFDGKYGRSGLAKILKGSKGLKDNDFNKEIFSSPFYGALSELTLAKITNEIDELIEKGNLKIKRVSFGRPVLSANLEVEIPKKVCKEEKPVEEFKDENLIKIAKLIDEGKNVFITGHAGTGKSYILNKLKEKYKSIVITSTTGIAAVNVKGQTLHSWAGVGICNIPPQACVDKIIKKAPVRKQIQACKILAIDEISMLDIKTFEYVDSVLRLVRDDFRPFGGIQVIFIGDFFQLPPVETSVEAERKYCFNSPLWKELKLNTVLLNKNYRQNEKNFITALSNMRTNGLTKEDIKLLCSREYKKEGNIEDILHIFATNKEADNYNISKFKSINSPEYNFFATDGVYKGQKFVENPSDERSINILNRIDTVCRAERNISLKLGARVMLLINLDFDKGLINGSCGTVQEIEDTFVLVKFDNGVVSKIARHDFEFYKNEKLIAMRRQLPLRLAYGITIHKSQGMSLDKLVVDCARIFERGQAYVALSRIKTLDGLYLCNFSPEKVMVDEKVAEFYNSLS